MARAKELEPIISTIRTLLRSTERSEVQQGLHTWNDQEDDFEVFLDILEGVLTTPLKKIYKQKLKENDDWWHKDFKENIHLFSSLFISFLHRNTILEWVLDKLHDFNEISKQNVTNTLSSLSTATGLQTTVPSADEGYFAKVGVKLRSHDVSEVQRGLERLDKDCKELEDFFHALDRILQIDSRWYIQKFLLTSSRNFVPLLNGFPHRKRIFSWILDKLELLLDDPYMKRSTNFSKGRYLANMMTKPRKENIHAIQELCKDLFPPRIQWPPTENYDEDIVCPYAQVDIIFNTYVSLEDVNQITLLHFERAKQQLSTTERKTIFTQKFDLLCTSEEYLYNFDPYNIDLLVLKRNWQRLKYRELWQDAVYSNRRRRVFWSDSSKVRCVHGLNALDTFGKHNIQNSTTETLGKLEELIQYTQSGNIAELSCVGFYKEHQKATSFGRVSIEFCQREIVWASANDCYSQCLSSASPYLESLGEYFHIQKELEANIPMTQKVFGASLVKFPTPSSLMKILLSEEDLREAGKAQEVIIRGYTLTPDTVIINIHVVFDDTLHDLIEGVQSLAKRYFNGQEFLIAVHD